MAQQPDSDAPYYALQQADHSWVVACISVAGLAAMLSPAPFTEATAKSLAAAFNEAYALGMKRIERQLSGAFIKAMNRAPAATRGSNHPACYSIEQVKVAY